MNIDLTGKGTLVTGGARGIGKCIANACADHGADIGIVDVDEEGGHETVAEIRSRGRSAVYYPCDVTAPDEVKKVVIGVQKDLGGLHILVNNAGITRDTLLLRMRDEEWSQVLDVNLKGAFHFTRAASKYLMKVDDGRIINIASVVGITGNAGQANYAASKGGLISFTKAVAKELAPRGVTVNAIAPGFIETKMTAGLDEKAKELLLKAIPIGRYGKPEEVANGVVFLASELASYVTGHVLVISGGMAM